MTVILCKFIVATTADNHRSSDFDIINPWLDYSHQFKFINIDFYFKPNTPFPL